MILDPGNRSHATRCHGQAMIPLKKFVDDPKEPGEENKDDHGTQVAGKIDALPGFVLQLDCGASENLGYPKMDEQLTIPLQNE